MEMMERAVVFIGLDDEHLATAALRVRGEVPDDAADEQRRIESGALEDRGDHRRRRRLAMGSGDTDGALMRHDLAQHLRAAQSSGFSPLTAAVTTTRSTPSR